MRYPMKLSIKAKVIPIWVVFSGLFFGACCFTNQADYSPYPNPDAGYVTDLANLLTDEQQEQLERLLSEKEEKTDVEIVVVTINSIKEFPGTSNRTIEEFAKALFDTYGIGNMPKNDGVLLLVAVRDRKARIELGAGYGHRRDSDSSRIMNKKIIPSFRKGRYSKGIIKGTESLAHEFAYVFPIPSWVLIVAIGITTYVLILIGISLFRNGKRGWGWICTGLLIVALLALSWLIVRFVRSILATNRRILDALPEADGYRGSGNGWFDSGGFGGGGFGGGFSGGGGATGSW
jgi:uncharacterized protein